MRRLIPRGCSIDSDERLLRQVNRPIVIVGHAIDVARNLVTITAYQFRERILVASQRSFEQCMVGDALNHNGRGHRGGSEIQLLNRSQRSHRAGRLSSNSAQLATCAKAIVDELYTEPTT